MYAGQAYHAIYNHIACPHGRGLSVSQFILSLVMKQNHYIIARMCGFYDFRTLSH